MVLRAPSKPRRSRPYRDASRGAATRSHVAGPFHRAACLSSPSAEDLALAWTGTRPGARFSLPKRARRSALLLVSPRALDHGRLLLSVFTSVTRARTTQSRTRPAGDMLCRRCRNRGTTANRDAETERRRADSRGSPRPIEVSFDARPVAGRCPCRSSSFPRERGETSRNDARNTRSPTSLRSEPRPTACCKDNGHSTVVSGLERPCGDRGDPATEVTTAIAAATQHARPPPSFRLAKPFVIPQKPTVRASPSGF